MLDPPRNRHTAWVIPDRILHRGDSSRTVCPVESLLGSAPDAVPLSVGYDVKTEGTVADSGVVNGFIRNGGFQRLHIFEADADHLAHRWVVHAGDSEFCNARLPGNDSAGVFLLKFRDIRRQVSPSDGGIRGIFRIDSDPVLARSVSLSDPDKTIECTVPVIYIRLLWHGDFNSGRMHDGRPNPDPDLH